MWHGYAGMELLTALDNPQKILVRDAILELGQQTGNRPERITQFRASNDKQSLILEVFIPERITKAQVVTKLANKLPFTETQINNNSNFIPFGGINATWQESGDECRTFIQANPLDWESEEI